ncbi:MAG: DUF2232 domain-containing protein, partial [Pseudomonadota bacterium]
MSAHLLIGVGAGLVSAALFTSAAMSAMVLGLVLYLCPLPLCLAGLGWGRQSIAVAGLVGSAVPLLFLGLGPALIYMATIALPTVLLVYLALQYRTAPDPAGGADPIVYWYPMGRLVAAATILAGTIATLMVLSLGPDMASYSAFIDGLMPVIHDAMSSSDVVWTEEMTDQFKTLIGRALPAVMAIVWSTIALFNIWLAGKIAKGSGHVLRPWPDLHALELPNAMVIAFALSLALSFVPGLLGLIATGFTGAFMFAYLLQGLSIIHFYTLGMPFRAGLLAVLYLAILFLGWVAIIVAILGLSEPLLGLRARMGR